LSEDYFRNRRFVVLSGDEKCKTVRIKIIAFPIIEKLIDIMVVILLGVIIIGVVAVVVVVVG